MHTPLYTPLAALLAVLLVLALPSAAEAVASRLTVAAAPAVLRLTALPGRFGDPSGNDLLDSVEGLAAADIEEVVRNVNPYEMNGESTLLGDTLYPDHSQSSLDLKYLKGANNAPVMASITSHMGESPLVGRDTLGRMEGSIPALKQARTLDGEALIRLRRGSSEQVQEAVTELYDDVTATRTGIVARVEWIRMQATGNGRVVYSEDGVQVDVDFLVPNNHKATLLNTARWGQADADIIGNLAAWQEVLVADRGHRAAVAITRQPVITAMLKDPKIRKAIWGVNADKMLTLADLNAFLEQQQLPRFVSYDLRARVILPNGLPSSVPFFPDNKIAMLPALASGALGKTRRAPTPEEVTKELAEGITVTDGKRITTRVYLSTKDPVGMVTRAVASAFCSFERAEDVFQAQVL
jgi:hypothetical protein